MKDQEPLLPGLYMVATPIGNLNDFSFRALHVLKNADWVAAEDTRESRKLLDAYGISTPLISFHEHSSDSKLEELLSKLKQGERGAYISDAGTPGICDPGADLVKRALEESLQVFPIPGASAPVTLLSASGFASSSFKFHGFFPRENKDRALWAKEVDAQPGLHVFFESPHRVRETLQFFRENFPQNLFVLGRELTKRFETIKRGTAANLAELLEKEEPRGEYVFILEVLPKDEKVLGEQETKILLKELADLGANQKVLLKVGMSRGLSKNQAYDLALEIKKS